jgi:RHS repeat-associated protein
MLPAAQMNMLPLAQLLLLKEAVDAASNQWEREQAERRRREADSSAVARRAKEEERAREEAIEAEKSRQAKPNQAKNPPPVFPFFWWELASGTSMHMNGRIYDPLLGRMLSADPHIQSPTNLQNYNRYSYVTNNPLSMTDPSGFFFKKLFKKIGKFFKKFWRPIVAITLAIVTAGALAHFAFSVGGGIFGAGGSIAALFTGQAGLGLGASIAVGAAGGFVGGFVNGGIRGALLGALTGGIAGGIGHAFAEGGMIGKELSDEAFRELARASAHGVTGGAVQELAGGEFGAGFAGSFAGSFAGHLGPQHDGNLFAQVTQAAVVGGTVSELSGGSFENGAVTAAFQHLFNNRMHKGTGKWRAHSEANARFHKKVNELSVASVGYAAEVNKNFWAIGDYVLSRTTQAFFGTTEILTGGVNLVNTKTDLDIFADNFPAVPLPNLLYIRRPIGPPVIETGWGKVYSGFSEFTRFAEPQANQFYNYYKNRADDALVRIFE